MFLFSAIFCLLTSSLGSPMPSPRIIGGTDASIEDVPFTASIQYEGLGHLCGATIISPEWVMTDAWCVLYLVDVEPYTVQVGSATSGNGTVHNVVEWINHPLADVIAHNYDFALVKVDPPFEFNSNVAAAALPALDQETPDGAIGVITEWGQVNNESSISVSQLQYADVSLLSDASCASELGVDYNERTLCAQGATTDVALCWRDEGGPLVVDGILLGVSLWPATCAEHQQVQKFARVASVRDWIDATIGARQTSFG